MKILIINESIVDFDVTETATTVVSPRAIYQKDVISGWTIVDATLPADFALGRYKYVNGAVIPIPPPVVVPQTVDPLRVIYLLDQMGLATAYAAWRDAPERTVLEQETLLRAKVWERDNPVLIAAATAMGITGEQLDQMFIQIGY